MTNVTDVTHVTPTAQPDANSASPGAADAAPTTGGKQTAALVVVGLAIFTDMLVYGLVVPILPGYAVSLGASQAALGALFGSYALALFIAAPLFGALSDRIGRRAPLLWGLAGLAAATLLFAFATNFPLLLAARTLQGIAAAATWTAGLALLADVFPPEARGKAMGIALTGQAFGMLLGPPLGGWLFQWGGYRLPFFIAAACAAGDGVLRLLLLRHLPRPRAERRISLWRLIHSRRLLVVSGVVALAAGLPSLLEPTLPLYLRAALRVSPGAIGLLFIVPTVAYGVATPVIGALSARLARPHMMLVGLAIMLISLPLLARATSVWFEVGALAALGVGLGLLLTPTLPELAAVVDRLGVGAYGVVYALYNTVYSFGMLVGPFAGGALAQALGLPLALLIVSAASLLYIPLLIGLARSANTSNP